MKNIIITLVSIYMTLDVFAFFMWIASGQHPVDGFYLGAVTAKVVLSIINVIG